MGNGPRKARGVVCLGFFNPTMHCPAHAQGHFHGSGEGTYVDGILTSGLEKGDSKTVWRYIKCMHQDSQDVHFSTEVGRTSPYRPVSKVPAPERPVQLCHHWWQSPWNRQYAPKPQYPQSDPWKCWNLESVSSCGTLGKQQDLTKFQSESWRN